MKVLDLRDNKIEKLCSEIAYLQSIMRLDLSNNSIDRYVCVSSTEQSNRFQLFPAFDKIFASSLNVVFICSLPSSLSTLTHLVSLQLDGNPIRSIRRDIIQGGTVRILKLLRDRFSQEEHVDEAKSTAVIGSESKAFPDRFVTNQNRLYAKQYNKMC